MKITSSSRVTPGEDWLIILVIELDWKFNSLFLYWTLADKLVSLLNKVDKLISLLTKWFDNSCSFVETTCINENYVYYLGPPVLRGVVVVHAAVKVGNRPPERVMVSLR